MTETMSNQLMRARQILIGEIFNHFEFPTDGTVTVLELMTDILVRQQKLAPTDHIGKRVVVTVEEFDDLEVDQGQQAVITWQDFNSYGEEIFTLFFDEEEHWGCTRDDFRFVGGD